MTEPATVGGELAGEVLVLNAGSSSLKISVHTRSGDCLWRDQSNWSIGAAERTAPEERLEAVLDAWLPEALSAWGEGLIRAGHRVVHGGERFTAPVRLDAEVLEVLEGLVPLAPLHNGPALRVMRWLTHWKPAIEQWACFDTAFHGTLPEAARTYAIPVHWRAEGLRRFGFHGLNHQHVAETVARRGEDLRLISCHLGAGCSLCAIRGGLSIATTMGYTPLEGLVMATRSGSIDPGLLLHLLRRGVTAEELDHDLQQESGLLGLSQLSPSMKDLRQAAAEGHAGAELAIAVFRHQLLQGIGAMAASLGGVDVIALTGGIGEHDRALGQELEAALTWLEPFELLRVPADEEGVIARHCAAAGA
ncbi:acetate/propionate family kinase [Cyanobium sp. N5-Cardenillas]|uniref:acetate/propionate family kinase n=1 Tax=Cyanobium sp. N5-Cardenillas TaxID=2823720 RepID=UPI0020CF2E66|nr:acetate kinase [Cyanobium sp. N5-Cardenillas]MCP9786170.1 acetate kinase [Cyanobium sp. N5-Cardenillas]